MPQQTGARFGSELLEDLAAGVNAFLQAKVKYRQTEDASARQEALLEMKQHDYELRTRMQDFREGAPDRADVVRAEERKLELEDQDRTERIAKEKQDRIDTQKKEESDRIDKKRTDAIAFYEKKIDRLQSEKDAATDFGEKAKIQAEIDRAESTIEGLTTETKVTPPTSTEVTSDFERAERKQRVQRITEGFARGDYGEDEYQRRLDAEYGIEAAPSETTGGGGGGASDDGISDAKLEALLSQTRADGTPVYSPVQEASIRARVDSGATLTSTDLKPWVEGPLTTADLATIISSHVKGTDITHQEVLQLGEFLKSRVSSLTGRNPFAPVIIESAISELASIPAGAPGSGERWDAFSDANIEGKYSDAFQPFLNVATSQLSFYPKEAREGLLYSLDNWAKLGARTGDYSALTEQILLLGKRKSSTNMQKRIESGGLLLQAAFKMRESLKVLEKAGVDIGRLPGLTEKAKQRLLGTVGEPLRKEVAVAIDVLRSQYLLALSGAAVSEGEFQRTAEDFIDLLNDEDLNTATVNGLLKISQEFMFNSYRGVFGRQIEKVLDEVTDGNGSEVLIDAIIGTTVATTFANVGDAVIPYPPTETPDNKPKEPRKGGFRVKPEGQ